MASDKQKIPGWAAFLSALFSMPRVFLNPALGVYCSLEKLLLKELVDRMEENSAANFKSQLKEINFVQHISTEKSELNFYRIGISGVNEHRVKKINGYGDEFLLAKVGFEPEDNHRIIYVCFYIVFGNLFSLEFSENIGIYRNTKGIKIHSCELYLDQ